MRKYIYLIFSLIICSVLNIDFIYDEINIHNYIYLFARNLYNYEIAVSSENIEVIDFYIYNEQLIIKPMSNKVVLPISGLITDLGENYIIIQNNEGTYRLDNIESNYFLYQYYNNYQILGSSEFLIITCDNYSPILDNLVIVYDQI